MLRLPVDPADNSLTKVTDELLRPNGLAFSADESLLYVSDTGQSHAPDWPDQIRVFDMVTGRTLTQGRVFADVDCGLPDGFRLDVWGNIWTSAGENVNVYSPGGALLGRIKLGSKTSNVVFGGPDGTTLFITSSAYVYAIEVAVTGQRRPG